MKTPVKYLDQTPLNQRCNDNHQRKAAKDAIVYGCLNLLGRDVSAFELECFRREYHRHHADGRGVHDWRAAAILFAICHLLFAIPAHASSLPPLPQAATIPPRTFHFAATAVATNGLESDYSKEVTTTNPTPNLAWDPSPTPGCTYTYTIWRGTNTAHYTATWSAGTNTTFTVPPVPDKTNRVLTLTTQNATNIQYRPWGGTWWLANRTNLLLHNPPVGLQYRPLGRSASKPARAWITITNF